MPTSINCILIKGEGHEDVTFDDYLFRCMGLHSREMSEGNYKLDSMSNYYQNRIKEDKKELAVLQKQTLKELRATKMLAHEQELIRDKETQINNERIKKIIADWTEKINNWIPPEKVTNIKKTMLSQVELLSHEIYERDAPEKPDLSDEGLKKSKEEHIGWCLESIERSKERLKEESERVNNNREWKLSLYQSMKNPPEEVQEVLDGLKNDNK